jgi:hypothetical protein
MYVEGNPVNRIDPTGYSPCSLGTCGPDVTSWFMGMMKEHYEKGSDTRNAIDNLQTSAMSHGLPVIAKLPVEALRLFEYALYGMALDYGRINFKPSAMTNCIGGDCSKLSIGHKRSVTLCGHCVDSSDMGNMMFGLGGSVRGYSLGTAYVSAYGFNAMTFLKAYAKDHTVNLSALTPYDAVGAIPGYLIAAAHAFNSQKLFCQMINATRPLGYNDNVDEANSQTPNYRPVTDDDIMRKNGGPRYSALERWSDGKSTIALLFGLNQ